MKKKDQQCKQSLHELDLFASKSFRNSSPATCHISDYLNQKEFNLVEPTVWACHDFLLMEITTNVTLCKVPDSNYGYVI